MSCDTPPVEHKSQTHDQVYMRPNAPLHLTALTQQDPDICRWSVVCSLCTDPQCDALAGIDMDNATVPFCEMVPDGVDTTGNSGMTLETLNLMPGFYRTFNKSRDVLECYREEACMGGSNADTYCAEGYAGPCEGFYLPIECLTVAGHGTYKQVVSPLIKSLQTFPPVDFVWNRRAELTTYMVRVYY